MCLVVGEWQWKWNTHVMMVDASSKGFSIEKSVWSYSEVSGVGRVREKGRYRLGGEQARSHALALGGFVLGDGGELLRDSEGQLVRVPNDVKDEIAALKYSKNSSFPEVPSYLLAASRWQTVRSGNWNFGEDILILESRALISAIERVGNSAPNSNVRVLFLSDNLAVVLAFGRYRAKNFKLLTLIRRAASYALARGF